MRTRKMCKFSLIVPCWRMFLFYNFFYIYFVYPHRILVVLVLYLHSYLTYLKEKEDKYTSH